jgi:DNA gyrase subunit A
MIPEAGRTAKGTNIVNILELQPGEKITTVIEVDNFDNSEDRYLTIVTKNGVLKRTKLSEFEYQRKGGKIAIGLDEGDELIGVLLTDGHKDIIIASASGNAVKFTEEGARTMGRTARGVIGIRLRGDDRVVGIVAAENDKQLLTITELGYGKRSEFYDFRLMKSRGGMGVMCHNVTERTGRVVGISAVSEDDDIMIITEGGTIIRTPVDSIPVYGRSAAGVIVMRVTEGQACAGFTTVPKAEEEETDAAEIAEE